MGGADTCLKESLRILSIRQYSEEEVRGKLRDRGFSDGPIEEALDRLKAYGYVNDLDLVKTLVEIKFTAQGFGRRRVKDYLVRRKIPQALFSEEIDMMIDRERAVERGVRLLTGRKRPFPTGTPKEREKLFRYLATRGFEIEECKDIISEYENKGGSEHERERS